MIHGKNQQLIIGIRFESHREALRVRALQCDLPTRHSAKNFRSYPMFPSIKIRTEYSRHVLRAHYQGFAPMGFASFIRTASNAAML